MRVPASTYRLQISSAFTLWDALGITDYVAALGADWLYVSPLLAAVPGSSHAYDVVDHATVDVERGGRDGLAALAAAARRCGLGILVDIVPNHVGIAEPMQNAWWRDVLTFGRTSRYADAFDIDWEFGGGKVRIPVLGDDDIPLRVVDGELRYGELRFPLAPGSAVEEMSADEVHRRQHYELIHWRRADDLLNYRRFFAVNTLAGIRVEIPWVFEETHREIVRWVRDGLVDGLRVDHPDGLADPGAYLDALQAATGGTYVLVEKILHGDEQLPPTWAVAGTTGYDALADIDRVLVDPAGRAALYSIDARLRGSRPPRWEDLVHDTKYEVATGMLRSEVLRIVRELGPDADASGTDAAAVEAAVVELLACFPVYRTYLPFGREHLDTAARRAAGRRPDLAATIDRLVPILADETHRAAVRFEQTSGMVMAKGVEDTAFYRHGRPSSLAEVGADPSEFSIHLDEFHRRQQVRQASMPHSLTTLSTHDTKRGEDVRARLHVLAEIPEEWGGTLQRLRERVDLGDPSLEQLLWEAIVGAWPASPDRLHDYAEKAAREAGTSTSWVDPDPSAEERIHRLVDLVFEDAVVAEEIERLVARVARPGWSNSLAAKLIQLTAPGVPDVYQGSELWHLSLVDPDNRRPVDFGLRRRLLGEVNAGELPPVDEGGAAKLLVTSRALCLRRDRPELFTRYVPLPSYGERGVHAIAFDRGGAVTVATRLPVGLADGGGWGDTTIELVSQPLVDVVTGRCYAGGTTSLADLLDTYPVALLAPLQETRPEPGLPEAGT